LKISDREEISAAAPKGITKAPAKNKKRAECISHWKERIQGLMGILPGEIE